MPLPAPRDGQSEKDFISSCMSSDVIQNEFDTQKQRIAVCYSQWKRSHKKSGKADWSEVEAEIKEKGLILTEDEARIILPGVSREEMEGGKKSPFSKDNAKENLFNEGGNIPGKK